MLFHQPPSGSNSYSQDSTPTVIVRPSVVLSTDFNRPLPAENDLVVFNQDNELAIGVIRPKDPGEKIKILTNDQLYGLLPHRYAVKIENIFNAILNTCYVEERFYNKHTSDPNKKRMREADGKREDAVGIIIDTKVTADVLLLPERNRVVRNVPDSHWMKIASYTSLSNTTYSKLSKENIIFYEGWFGRIFAINQHFDLSMLFDGKTHKMTMKLTSHPRSYNKILIRPPVDENKAFYAGEMVRVELSDLISNMHWEESIPHRLAEINLQNKNAMYDCKIEKIVMHSVGANWTTSPSNANRPPSTIEKHNLHKMVRIDFQSPSPFSIHDRFKFFSQGIKPEQVTTLEKWRSELNDEFAHRFEEASASLSDSNGPSSKKAKSGDNLNDVQMKDIDNLCLKEDMKYAENLLGASFVGEILRPVMTCDIKLLNGTIIHNVPSYELSAYKLDQLPFSLMPGTIVIKKTSKNHGNEFGLVMQIYMKDNKSECLIVENLEDGRQCVRFFDMTEDSLWPFQLKSFSLASGFMWPSSSSMGSFLSTPRDPVSTFNSLFFCIDEAREERSQAYNALISKYVVQAPTRIIFEDVREYAMGFLIKCMLKEVEQSCKSNHTHEQLRANELYEIIPLLLGMDSQTIKQVFKTFLFVANLPETECPTFPDAMDTFITSPNEISVLDSPRAEKALEMFEIGVEFHDKMLLICNKAIASNDLSFKRFKTDLSLARHIAPTLYYLAARYQFDLNYFPVRDKAGEPDFQYVAHCLRHLHYLSYPNELNRQLVDLDQELVNAITKGTVEAKVEMDLNATDNNPPEQTVSPRQVIDSILKEGHTEKKVFDSFSWGSQFLLLLSISSFKLLAQLGLLSLSQPVSCLIKQLHPPAFFSRIASDATLRPLTDAVLELFGRRFFDLLFIYSQYLKRHSRSADKTLEFVQKAGSHVMRPLVHTKEIVNCLKVILPAVREEEKRKMLRSIFTTASGGSFEVLEKCTTHNYLNMKNSNITGLSRIILKEYKLLADLPSGIHVRAFSDRLDLFTAVIVGPVGTPFDSTPFVFDIWLPGNYPNEPPKVFYNVNSSVRLNPNLYQCGKVCLSLLGTWQGTGSERWDSQTSSIMQVVVSIQALILNRDPYFNEPGYELSRGRPHATQRSAAYNETASCSALEYFLNTYQKSRDCVAKLIRHHCEQEYPGLRERLTTIIDEEKSSYDLTFSWDYKRKIMELIDKMDKILVTIRRRYFTADETRPEHMIADAEAKTV
ncbi:hypothetical protein WR25_01245 [Diploscapter pachys]|uniref:UBC core domain-containing protein n=1 Tax=Diploscapter pachys TaxID=2018661 RepID=A0A2A2JXB7_9BILA|nr:hypothetical protein WR25_01245 [Diploscapter pachys]